MRIIDAAHRKLQSEQTISSDQFCLGNEPAQFRQAVHSRLFDKKLD